LLSQLQALGNVALTICVGATAIVAAVMVAHLFFQLTEWLDRRFLGGQGWVAAILPGCTIAFVIGMLIRYNFGF
jgi:hypothetical protein